jgi:hypothetical protein
LTSPQFYRRIIALLVWALALTVLENRRLRILQEQKAREEKALEREGMLFLEFMDETAPTEVIPEHEQRLQQRHREGDIDYALTEAQFALWKQKKE